MLVNYFKCGVLPLNNSSDSRQLQRRNQLTWEDNRVADLRLRDYIIPEILMKRREWEWEWEGIQDWEIISFQRYWWRQWEWEWEWEGI